MRVYFLTVLLSVFAALLQVMTVLSFTSNLRNLRCINTKCAYKITLRKPKLYFKEDQNDERPIQLSDLFSLRKLVNTLEPQKAVGIVEGPDHRIVRKIDYRDSSNKPWRTLKLGEFGPPSVRIPYPLAELAAIRIRLVPNAHGSTVIKFVAAHLCDGRQVIRNQQKPCQAYQRSKSCHYCGNVVKLEVKVTPVPDRPISIRPLPFPPVPGSSDLIHKRGCKVGTLLKVKPYLSEKLMNSDKKAVRDAFRETMSKDDVNPKDLLTLLGRAGSSASHRHSVEDFDGDKLGIAVLRDSPGLHEKTMANIGKWHFKTPAQNQWKPLKDLVNSTCSKCKCLIVLNPDDRLKFVPNKGTKQWDKVKIRLVFHGRKVKDARQTGSSCMAVTNDQHLSNGTTHMEVSYLGCDGFPDSKAVTDQCGKCGGNNDCLGCDKQKNSTAKIACNVCYGGTTGIPNPLDNCTRYCTDPSYKDGCNFECAKLNKPDCNGTCFGTAKIDECGKCVGGRTGHRWNYLMDACRVCHGDNSTCLDCKGVINGPNKKDDCGECHPPGSPKFNSKCKKIVYLRPSSQFRALTASVINVGVAGIQSATKAACSLTNKKTKKKVALIEVSRTEIKKSIAQFDLAIPATVAGGEYQLECTTKPGGVSVTYHGSLHAIATGSLRCTASKPLFAVTGKKTTVTITGSGFVNSSEASFKLQRLSKSRIARRVYTHTLYRSRVTFESSSSVKCQIPALNRPVDRICISLSPQLQCCTPFHIKTPAARPLSCSIHASLSLYITFNKPVKLAKDKRQVRCGDVFNKATCTRIGFGEKERIKINRIRTSTFKLEKLQKEDILTNGVTVSVVGRGFRRDSVYDTIYDNKEAIIDLKCKTPPTRVRTVVLKLATGRGCTPKLQARAKPGIQHYSWTVSLPSGASSSPAITQSLVKINNMLKKHKRKHLNKIPLHLLPNNVPEIKVEVTVGGKIGKAVSAAVVLKTRNTGLKVRIKGFVNRKKIVLISTVSCARGKVAGFEWKCDLPGLRLGDRANKRMLYLKMSQVRPLYKKFNKPFNCTYTDGTASGTFQVRLKLGKPLKCFIKDGKSAVVGESQRSLKLRSRSEDPDNDKEEMKHSWKCEDSKKAPCVNQDGKTITFPESPGTIVNLTALRKRANETFKFTLTISKGKRNTTCSVKRTIKAGHPPNCTLETIADAVNPNKKTRLVGYIQGSSKETNYELEVLDSESDEFVNITGLFSAATPYEGAVKMAKRRGLRRRVQFVIKPGALQDNATYTVRIKCWDNNTDSVGEIELKTKSRPSKGNLTADPPDGVASETDYTLSNEDEDEEDEYDKEDGLTDNQKKFRCGIYVENKRKKRKEKKYLTDSSDIDQCQVKLQSGQKDNNYTLESFLQTCDKDDVCNEAKRNVTVRPRSKPISSDDVKNVSTAVDDALNTCDTSRVRVAIAPLLDTLKRTSEGNTTMGPEVQDQLTTIMSEKVLPEVLNCVEDDGEGDEELKSTARDVFVLALTAEGVADALPKKLVSRLSNYIVKAANQNDDEEEPSSSSRTKRAVGEPTQNVLAKTVQEVESNLVIYEKLISPYDYSTEMMKVKSDFLVLLNDLGRSMCKDLTNGEPAKVAESSTTVLRSDQNSFEHVHTNYSLIGCEQCADYPHASVRVLLGSSLGETYDEWDCNEDACSGACVVSSQVRNTSM